MVLKCKQQNQNHYPKLLGILNNLMPPIGLQAAVTKLGCVNTLQQCQEPTTRCKKKKKFPGKTCIAMNVYLCSKYILSEVA